MADFGLTHEANSIGHTRYLSDTGGRWNLPFAELQDRFAAEGGFLQMLDPSGLVGVRRARRSSRRPSRRAGVRALASHSSAIRPPPRSTSSSAGDCCSRRAIDMNRDLFGGNPQMVRDEKARTDFFLDHPTVGSADARTT